MREGYEVCVREGGGEAAEIGTRVYFDELHLFLFSLTVGAKFSSQQRDIAVPDRAMKLSAKQSQSSSQRKNN